MTWTINRRIAAGFAVLLLLVVALPTMGFLAVERSNTAYAAALWSVDFERMPTLVAQSNERRSRIDDLRFLLTRDEQSANAQDSTYRLARSGLVGVRDSARTTEARALIVGAIETLDAWNAAVKRGFEAIRAGNRAEAQRLSDGTAEPLAVRLRAQLQAVIDHAQSESDSATARARAAGSAIQRIFLFGGLFAVVVGLLAAWFLRLGVGKPLIETTSVLATSASEILAATTQQASGITETAAAVTQTMTTVDEVVQTSEQASQRARAVAESAQHAAEVSVAGRRAIEDSVAAMASVKTQVESVATSIVALAEQAQAIGEITASVNDIAEPVNILALNASVEAARAGEHGRGFSVVAAEIKNLAAQAKQATVQVRQILSEVQRATNTAVMTTEQGTREVAAATKLVTEAGGTIRSLADAVAEAAQTASQIAASAGQQAVGMTQIRRAIANIQDASQQNLASTRQAERAARNLDALGIRLLRLVGVARRADLAEMAR